MSALRYISGAPIGEIVLSQPAKRNAVSAAMWAALGGAVDEAARDAGARLIVIRGEGGHFAAGADITEFAEVYRTSESADAYTRVMLDSLAALEALGTPTLAMIRGACVGGGASIALACDFRFAADTARIGVTPGKLGLVYSLADTRRLAAVAGVSGAKDLLMTGRLIDGAEALSLGLCDRLYADEELEGAVLAFARQIAQTSSFSAGATKAMFALLKSRAQDDDLEAARLLVEAFTGPDFQEGYKAFLEKRRPKFS